jgi:hypothetical protein
MNLTQKMKANKTMRGQAVSNHRRRKDKELIQLHKIKQLNNKNNVMTGITIYLSISTLNVNRLNFSIKRYHLANWTKKEDPTICCLQDIHLIDRNKHQLRVKGWKKIY